MQNKKALREGIMEDLPEEGKLGLYFHWWVGASESKEMWKS